MSEASQRAGSGERSRPGEEEDEVLDGVPVLAEEQQTAPQPTGPGAAVERAVPAIPVVQAAAVAAGGFVAGAAVVGLVHRRRRRALLLGKSRAGRKLARGGASRRGGRTAELVQIVGSRSLLVDVHLLGGASGNR